jgi:hypothetical protein
MNRWVLRTKKSTDDKKFVELLVYVTSRSENDSKFGATKLNKLLFYSDFLAYRTLGRAISNHDYQKLVHGPAPKAIVPILKRLIKSGQIAEAERNYFGHKQKRILALREADLTVFSGPEMALIDQVIEHFKDDGAKDISNRSHRFIIGWETAKLNEVIPYDLALVNNKPTIDDATIAFAKNLPPLSGVRKN